MSGSGRGAAVVVGALMLLPASASAHQFRAAVLRLEAVDGGRYTVAFRLPPASQAGELPEDGLGLRFSADCKRDGPVVVCAGDGPRTVEVLGLDRHPVEVVVRVVGLDGVGRTAVLDPADPELAFGDPPDPGAMAAFTRFLGVGVEHILLGFDHLLFVLGLLFVVSGARRLVVTLTAFTVAHSVTLALSVLDVVQLAQPPVEAVIALSVLLLAVEAASALRATEPARPTLVRRHPATVAFLFGLVHGLGFAGALREVGLPSSRLPAALAGFNVGVEVGQLAVVAVALLAARFAPPLLRRPGVRRATVYALGTVAATWTLDRVGGLLASLV